MLCAEDGAAGKNFLTPEIFAVVTNRLAEGHGTIESFRLLHNMLSSEPMCFNLFGPLVGNPERATRMLRALVGDDVVRVTALKIEWAPEPADSSLGDRTAFDAYFEYVRPGGGTVAVGVETKLTDSFSSKVYGGEKYRRWMRTPRSPFRAVAWDPVAKPDVNQLWRNHLLALALRDRPGSDIGAVRSVVAIHPADLASALAAESYRHLLCADDDTFVVWTHDDIVEAFDRAAVDDAEREWLAAFRARYLDMTEAT